MRAFLDTNVLLYLLSGDEAKANRAEQVVAGGGIISVQVLNEFVSVATRKLAMSIDEVVEVLGIIRHACKVVPLSAESHDVACTLVRKYGYHIYDASILATAVLSGCGMIYSEDMQDGMLINGKLVIRNPFNNPPE